MIVRTDWGIVRGTMGDGHQAARPCRRVSREKTPMRSAARKWQAGCSTLLGVTMKNIEPPVLDQDVAARALAAYRDQPALFLTVAQAARLWQVDLGSAAEVLDTLTRSGRLRRVGTRYCNCGGELVSASGDPAATRTLN